MLTLLSFLYYTTDRFYFKIVKKKLNIIIFYKLFALVVCSRILLNLGLYILKPDTDPTVCIQKIQSSVHKPDNIKHLPA